ncbi:MAG: hypothetical protein GVY35_02725 [Bacteroidetes bacterium]|jgi:hypothetical protein|nr:hypothetical protein [Bacteroidota bacterium]
MHQTVRRTLACVFLGAFGLLGLHAHNGPAHALPTPAAPSDSTAHRSPASSAQRIGPQIGVFVQTVLHTSRGHTAAPEGFYVPRARLGAEGQFESIAYEVEADFADDVLLKDAWAAYRARPHLTLRAGQFKVPFSYSELVSSAATDFVQRPRVARRLSVGRRTGVDVGYRAWDERMRFQGGVFSGETSLAEEWVAAARLTWAAPTRGVRSVVGANVAYVRSTENRGHARYGADVRVMQGPAFLTAEVLAAPDTRAGPEMGTYVTAGYALADGHLVRAQWDYVSGAVPAAASEGPTPARSMIGVGYTLRLAAPLRVEVDYLAPPTADAFDERAVFVNLQVSL